MQQANRRARIFSVDADYAAYLARLRSDAERLGLALLAYCLLPTHVHLIAVPETEWALGRTLRDTHTAYALYRSRDSQV
jgi:putative transposase